MWNVVLLDEVADWFGGLDEEDAVVVAAAIDILEAEGPTLGRPLADRLKGSAVHNLKELRPSGKSIRILFVFDPKKNAVLLVAGDKAGDWSGWYGKNIPTAEQRYAEWLDGMHDVERA